jgi:3-hexulose-6-phosphate synthase
MKLQISFDTTDLEKTLQIAKNVQEYADIIEVGIVLIHAHGKKAVEQFRTTFAQKTLLVDTKIIDRGKQIVEELAPLGIDWITVMAGTRKSIIHSTCLHAQEYGIKVMLDLLDSASPGQSALEAENLGADALVFHQPHDEEDSLLFLDKWGMVKGNTKLPIFVSGKIKRDTIHDIMKVNPDGIIVGKSITEAENPAQEAQFFYELAHKE